MESCYKNMSKKRNIRAFKKKFEYLFLHREKIEEIHTYTNKSINSFNKKRE